MSTARVAQGFDPGNVNLSTADPAAVVCFLNSSDNEYNGHLGARISALFVILIVSTATTFFPVVVKRSRRFRVPTYVYLFARYFGAGVIVATAFIHLLDPAYGEIGPNTCVGMTGGWAQYSWCPAIVLTSVMVIFLMDFGAERYVEIKYGNDLTVDVENLVTSEMEQSAAETLKARESGNTDRANDKMKDRVSSTSPSQGRSNGRRPSQVDDTATANTLAFQKKFYESSGDDEKDNKLDAEFADVAFKQQIAAFLILEFGVIFHSVIIGLNLGVVGQEFATLYPVLIFHQSFEGLGIGARMSAIPFPPRLSKLPYLLCIAYGLTTPISIAIGLGLRTTYNPGSFTANVVSGVLDSMSAGILIYTGLVELLARDFLFNPTRTRSGKRLAFMVGCVMLGAGLMALLGKWA